MSNEPLLFELKPLANQDSLLLQTNVNVQATGTVFCSNQSETLDFVSVGIVSNGNVLSSNSWILFESTAHPGLPIYLQQICLGSEDAIYVKSQYGTSNFIFNGVTP